MEEAYRVVVNGEGQYSIYPVNKDVPSGWSATGWEGSRELAMERIEWLIYKPLPADYVEFIKRQRESANREAREKGLPETQWEDPNEERARLREERKRKERGK